MTKNMLVFIATLTITAITIATVMWLLCDGIRYKDCFYQNAFLGIMIFFGWLPAFIVTCDYNEYIDKKEIDKL